MVGSLAIRRTTESQLLCGVGDVAGRVEHAHGGDAGLQGVHRMAGFGQALDEVDELVLDAAVVAELVVEVGQLALRGQVALEQQPGGLLETALAGQRFDGDAAVFQAGAFAVDETDRRLRDRHVGQARPKLQLDSWRFHPDFVACIRPRNPAARWRLYAKSDAQGQIGGEPPGSSH